jgi:hypothetical protein
MPQVSQPFAFDTAKEVKEYMFFLENLGHS